MVIHYLLVVVKIIKFHAGVFLPHIDTDHINTFCCDKCVTKFKRCDRCGFIGEKQYGSECEKCSEYKQDIVGGNCQQSFNCQACIPTGHQRYSYICR